MTKELFRINEDWGINLTTHESTGYKFVAIDLGFLTSFWFNYLGFMLTTKYFLLIVAPTDKTHKFVFQRF